MLLRLRIRTRYENGRSRVSDTPIRLSLSAIASLDFRPGEYKHIDFGVAVLLQL